MSTREDAKAHPLSYLAAGRMPLWLASTFALIASMGLSLLFAGVDLGTLPFSGGTIANNFVVFVIPPGLLVGTVARYKGRSVVKWTLAGFAGILLSPVFPFLPLTTLLTLVLGVRVPYKVPEAELEAAEHPRAMRQLVAVREDLWKLYQQMEDRYVHKDFPWLTAIGDTLEPIATRLERVREQHSQRGHEARTNLIVAIKMDRVVAEESQAVLSAIDEVPELASLAAQGSGMPAKGKPAKALAKRLRRIEMMLNGAKLQVSNAGGVLQALGYSASDGDAQEPDDESRDEPAGREPLPPPPTATRPRPRRPVRRRRH